MTKSLIYKEWLKTRRTFWVLAAIGIILAVYAVMGIRRVEVSKGVEHIWMIMLLKDQTFVDVLKYFPLLSGIVLAIAQMFPELQQKRLKLTLHLPYPQHKTVALMLVAGVAELLTIFVAQLLIVGLYYCDIIAPEMTHAVIITVVPWQVCGIAAYLFISAICLEGTWRRRVLLALISAASVAVFFKQPMPQAYADFLPWLIILLVPAVALVYLSVNRFKEGRQD